MATVTLVVGPSNAGKTTEMMRIYASFPPGTAQGIVQTKTLDRNAQLTGYSLRNLADSSEYPLIVLADSRQPCPMGWFKYDRFWFCEASFLRGIDLLEKACLDPHIKTILIDEIGNVEADGKGYDNILRNVLRSSKDVILSVSYAHLERILDTYDIHIYHQIQIYILHA